MKRVNLAELKERFRGLLSRKYTFIFVPDVTGRFIRFSTPKAVVKGAVGLVAVIGVCFALFSISILKKAEELSELRDLRGVTVSQKLEIQQFSQKMKMIETQLSRLEKFDRKLRIITALEKQTPSTSDFGLGGPTMDKDVDFSSATGRLNQSVIDGLNNDLNQIKQQAETQEISFFELDEHFKEQSAMLSHTPSIWPVRGWITSTFGYRRSPFTNMRELHEGLDIATQNGSPVVAPASGIVVNAGIHRGYGNMVEIDHGYGVSTRYGHNSKLMVNVGRKVKRGDVVALVGSTGRSTGPHLHYEVLLNGVPVNPYRYILED
ncbi:MAG: M23 family metallopeptidase [Nitrospinae bacterium]|nr:M23 family metallopeptidase [Nitrospinota bacterium]